MTDGGQTATTTANTVIAKRRAVKTNDSPSKITITRNKNRNNTSILGGAYRLRRPKRTPTS